MPELERTVGLMKKVVERVQQENEQLKKAPGVTTQTEIHNLKDQNRELKVSSPFILKERGNQTVDGSINRPGWIQDF